MFIRNPNEVDVIRLSIVVFVGLFPLSLLAHQNPLFDSFLKGVKCQRTFEHDGTKTAIISFIKYDHSIVKIAQDSAKSPDIQRGFDLMLSKIVENPDLLTPDNKHGTIRPRPNGYFGIKNGSARMYIKVVDQDGYRYVFILGKSNKQYQQKLFDKLIIMYPEGFAQESNAKHRGRSGN